MFEDSLMESNHGLRTRSPYWSVLALVVNGTAIAVLTLWPLLHPEALPRQMMTSLLVAPAPPPPPPPAMAQVKVRVASQTLAAALAAPSQIPHTIKMVSEASATPPGLPGVVGIQDMGDANGIGSVLAGTGAGPTVVVTNPRPQKLSISSGVMAGNLLEKVTPQYPSIARAARIEGTVVLQATIAKDGTIQNLRVLAGPPMLQAAALDAVRSWRYKPYLLNGDPVAVETTVNVVFHLGE